MNHLKNPVDRWLTAIDMIEIFESGFYLMIFFKFLERIID